MKWVKYPDLEPLKRLRNEGRELLGKIIDFTEKRDGENISIWLDDENNYHISSHNLEVADENIQDRLKATPEWLKILELLMDEKNNYDNDYILYGELLKIVSPTRIEPRRKYTHWILFDIYDVNNQRWLDYNAVYQKGYHFKIPVVKLVSSTMCLSMDELEKEISSCKRWCKRHRREGVVGKNYHEGISFKEKVDLPKRPKLDRPERSEVEYPVMPEETIIRALQHAFDEVGEEDWRNVKIAMPVVAKHISTEASEHNYSPPKNFYNYYVNTPLEIIKGEK